MDKKTIPLLTILIISLAFNIYFSYYYPILLGEYRNLLERYKGLQANYQALNNTYHQLKKEYIKLAQDYEDLLEAYSKLSTNYTRLLNKYTQLEYAYEESKKRIQNLTIEVISLRGRLEVHEDLNKYVKEYFLLVKSYKETVLKEIDEEIQYHLSYIFNKLNLNFITLRTTTIQYALKLIYEAINLHTAYYPDDLYWYIENNSLIYEDNRVSRPWYTVGRGGGDCEDLALLLYTLIKYTLNKKGVNAYIIGVTGEETETARIAVLVEYQGKYCILDPAGAYITLDTRLYLKFIMKKGRETWYVWLPPLSIRPDIKEWLMERGYATFDYKPIYKGGTIQPYYFTTLHKAIIHWLEYWKGEYYKPYVYIIANNEIELTFENYEDFITWLNTHESVAH